MMIRFTILLLVASTAVALDYPHNTAEPQKSGWPLTAEERAYITEKAEHDRRPGRESNKHLPQLWPVVPSAGFFGGDAWLKIHEGLVKTVQANQGPLDVLLVGDSITIQWGDSWKKHFPDLKAVNIGIGGDKTQNVLWRLDHGGVDGLQPKAIVLMIGNNNMFFTPETGIEAAALGIQMCVKNLHEKFPSSQIIVTEILPAHLPGNAFYEDIKKTNRVLLTLGVQSLDVSPEVHKLHLWRDFTNADGTLKKDLFTPDNIHLSPAGYAVYAERLKPLLDEFLGKNKSVLNTEPPGNVGREQTEAKLKIGDIAPKLSCGTWAQGTPVRSFEKDKVYLVEFWATWCGPCVTSIPHLNEIATKFKDKGLVVIGQAIWEQDTSKVKPFVEKMGDKMTYRVALDDDEGTMAQTWMKAAGENGIPTAFLVGKDGKIAWIGYPWTLQEDLIEQVLTGTYDVAKAAADYRKRKNYEAKTQPFWQQFGKAREAKQWADAERALNEIEKVAEPGDREKLAGVRLDILLGRGEHDTAAALADKISQQEEFKTDALKLNQLSWLLLENEDLKGTALAIAHKLAVRANEAAGGKDARILDTLARAVFMQGDKQRAISLQEKAVALCDDADLKNKFRTTLDSFKAGTLIAIKDRVPGTPKSAPLSDHICGVGLRFDRVGQEIVIHKILAESPAAESEILVGDKILAVAQGDEQAVSVKNLEIEDIQTLIRGNAGSIVRLSIARSGEDESLARTVTLTRRDISNLVRAKGVKPLKIGDAAPKLRVGAWVQGEPITEFEKGKAYLVDFWATTCGPCVALIPHLNEIASKFKDKGLVVIAQDIWDKDESKVKQLIKKMGAKMTYRVAMDDHKKTMEESWLYAAGQIGIPCAFLVGTDGKIAWIGHPGVSSLNGIIESVLNKNTAAANTSKATAGITLQSKPVLTYPYAPYHEGKMDPQLTGWPLTAEELAWVAKGEYFRKPGHEAQKHLPEMWFVVPTASRWGGDGQANEWIEHHAQCIEKVQTMKGGIDVALIGDSITQGWGGGWDGAPLSAEWQKHFGDKKTVNLGIGGDRMENVLWRLDHGALDGVSPKVIVLMIGVNNAPLVEANGVPVSAAAQGLKLCVDNLRIRCPQSRIVLVKILPAFNPAGGVGAKISEINAALDGFKLDADGNVQVLDLWKSFTNEDGTLKTALYSDGHLHLGPAGYEALAQGLKPLLLKL
jgi:thiol-disulfide isomerase/thioredoxin/lysophospholipase L1-like esterase/tetratricopeptide (TPR) repeat protein